MSSPCGSFRLCFMLFFLQFLIMISIVEPRELPRPFNNSVSAILVFGDSTVDPGNNNFIGTAFRSNFPPYGIDFADKIPTGRFTDGRLVTDFTASYVGIKENVPPYLDPELSLEELKTGVSFASAGSGLDQLTTDLLGVIPMQKQLEYFKEYRTKLEKGIGKAKTKTLIGKAAFIISVGINDFFFSYLLTPFRRKNYDIAGYQQFLLQNLQQFIQVLRKEGARMIVVVGQPPMGCVPIAITFMSGNALGQRSCVDSLSSIGFDYNQKLQNVIKQMDEPNSKVIYADIYYPILDMVKRPSQFGFDEVNVGCCGTGLAELTFLCNKQSSICSDPNKYMFFDSAHATEATYKYVFQSMRPTIDNAIKNFPR